MRKGKRLIGRPILSLAEGVRLGEVKDVILGATSESVAGLLVDEGGLFGSAHVVPTEEIESFGRDAVVVTDRSSIRPASEVPDIKEILDRKTSLIGTRVFTETGDAQGAVSDIYFDEASGRVLSLEVTGGAWQDATKGVRNLPLSEVMRTGPEILYVHPETAELLEAQRGGIGGALADAGDAARDTAAGAAATVRQEAAAADPEDRLVGARTGVDVEDHRGAVIIPAGRRVTPEDLERARRAGRVEELANAVGMGQLGRGKDGVADALDSAGDRASSLWDQFSRRLGYASDATGRRIDEEQTKQRLARIEDAVGRPVTKVILDLHDAVVLDVGDIVTHAAVQRAHEAGALDSLLDSVYKADVRFEKDELRAQREGEATLDEAAGTGAPIVEEMRDKVRHEQAKRDNKAPSAPKAPTPSKAPARPRRAPEQLERPEPIGSEATAADIGEAKTTRLTAVGPGRPSGVER